MDHFTHLIAWQRGMALVREIHAITQKLPKDELFGMTAQLRRASTSIIANIAEGCGRYTFADKAHKYVIARGECREVESHLYVIVELNYVTKEEASNGLELATEVGRILSGLIASCRRHS